MALARLEVVLTMLALADVPVVAKVQRGLALAELAGRRARHMQS